MRGFKSPVTKTITLTRNGESVELVIHPYPLGFASYLSDVFPAPVEEDKRGRHNDRVGLCLLAEAMRPGCDLQAMRTSFPEGVQGWEAYADAVLAELRAAHLTDGELQVIGKAAAELSKSAGGHDLGKSSGSSPRGGEPSAQKG